MLRACGSGGQETYISAWRSENFLESSNEHCTYGWLIKILRRRLCDVLRKNGPQLVFYGEELIIEVEPEAPVDNLSAVLQNALNRLKPEFKETLLLVVVSELTHKEVADMLHIPIGTVLSRINRARTFLRKELIKS